MQDAAVEFNLNIEDFKKRRQNPLHNAVLKSNYGFIQLLIDCGIDLAMKDSKKWTSMHYACLVGSIEMVQLLINNIPEFDTASVTSAQNTIFHFAAQNPDPQVLKLVLDKFPLVDPATVGGWKMIHFAVECGKKETIQFLLESEQKYGYNIEERATENETILHVACWLRNIEIVDLIFEALQKRKSEINFDTPDNLQDTCLHYICANSNLDVPILLLKRFPQKINVRCSRGRHFLHLACQFGCLEFIKYMCNLRDPDIDFNAVDDEGYSPLYYACVFGQYEVVKFFFDNFVCLRVNILNEWNQGKAIALQEGHKDISKLFSFWNYIKVSYRAFRK